MKLQQLDRKGNLDVLRQGDDLYLESLFSDMEGDYRDESCFMSQAGGRLWHSERHLIYVVGWTEGRTEGKAIRCFEADS